jgi:hypothetical protein
MTLKSWTISFHCGDLTRCQHAFNTCMCIPATATISHCRWRPDRSSAGTMNRFAKESLRAIVRARTPKFVCLGVFMRMTCAFHIILFCFPHIGRSMSGRTYWVFVPAFTCCLSILRAWVFVARCGPIPRITPTCQPSTIKSFVGYTCALPCGVCFTQRHTICFAVTPRRHTIASCAWT